MKKLLMYLSATLAFIIAAMTFRGARLRRQRVKAESALAHSAYEKAREDMKREGEKRHAELIEDIVTNTNSGADRLMRRDAARTRASDADGDPST